MIVYGTIIFIALTALTGLAIDGARWMMLRSNLQFVVSSGAAAGSRVLADKDTKSIAKAKTEATAVAQANIAMLNDGFTSVAVTGIRVLSSIDPIIDAGDDASAKYIRLQAAGRIQPLLPFVPDILSATATAVD